MRHLRIRRIKLVLILSLIVAVAFAPAAFGGLASSPLGVKGPTVLAGLGSCPLGAVSFDAVP
jgi:hypothetical protein